MKVLLHNHTPFMLAHGGAQIQIEQTRAALERIGVEVEYLRWWDDSQTGDVIHFFGRMPIWLTQAARAKNIKVVISDLMTEQGSRSPGRLWRQRFMSRLLKTALPSSMLAPFNWESYVLADACVALTEHEAYLLAYLLDAPRNRLHVVPNGVEEVFLKSSPATRGPWLVCTATITERKRVAELAEAAVKAGTPLWIVGKAYAETDAYAARFLKLARENPKVLRFEGAISDRARMAQVYRESRGFALLSTMESLSLSALEAAACECPLLLSDLPWARTVFKENAAYCPVTDEVSRTAAALRSFYDAAPGLKPPPKPSTWTDVARQLEAVYLGVLKTSR